MIVKGFKTLEQLEEKLKAVPEEKRKVIVLVGRHPNEGTHLIANRHHDKWEKHGAVVVRIPAHWTPHGLWGKAIKENLAPRVVKKMHDDIPTDSELVDFLDRAGFKVPVVSFHGTTTSRKAIEFQTGSKSPNIHFHMSIGWPVFVPPAHPNEITVEHWYPGPEYKLNKIALVRNLKRRYRFTPKPGLQHDYVARPNADSSVCRLFLRNDMFKREPAKEFEEVLAHLSETGLKKK